MVTLTQANWEKEVINSKVPVVVDFWGPGCAPCKQMEPLLQDAEKDFSDVVKFGKVNTNTDSGLAMKYGVRNIPTLMIFKNGEMKGQNVGSVRQPELIRFLHKVV